MSDPRVLLYGRAGCHLCEEARVVVARVCDEAGLPWSEIDVDDPPVPGEPDLFEAYGESVPVLVVDGVEVARWRVSERAMRAALA
jgi:glutaredoxin